MQKKLLTQYLQGDSGGGITKNYNPSPSKQDAIVFSRNILVGITTGTDNNSTGIIRTMGIDVRKIVHYIMSLTAIPTWKKNKCTIL